MFTIYRHPRDYPGGYTITEWESDRGRVERVGRLADTDSLEHARALIPAGMQRLDRHPDDDAVIVETWI